MRTTITIILLLGSLFLTAFSKEDVLVVNSCLRDINETDLFAKFGDNIQIGPLNYCSEENAKPVDGDIFIFGYGHGKFSGEDQEVCFGHGCIMGDVYSRTMQYRPNILLGEFPKHYFSLRIKESAKLELERFQFYPFPFIKHVDGLYLNSKDDRNVKMACFIWSGHKKEEKIRLLSECNQRWIERNEPIIWMEYKVGNEWQKRKVTTY